MAVLVGIDEAGFGPILGPLIVSSSTFALSPNLLETDLWQILRRSVSNQVKGLLGRLLITDSKKAKNKTYGIKHLQRTVLAALKCLDKNPSNFLELLEILSPDCIEHAAEYPWYKKIALYPLAVNKDDISIASGVFTDDLSSNGIRLLEIKSKCLDVGHYNRLVGDVKNKSNVLFTIVCQLLQNAFDKFGTDDLHIIVDRQGGKDYYATSLKRMFPQMDLKIINEDKIRSSYELRDAGKKGLIHFVVEADNCFLPVSLASMASKYIRELFVDNINLYFKAFKPQLKATAGYWTDGTRFIEELKKIPDLKFNANQLVRLK